MQDLKVVRFSKPQEFLAIHEALQDQNGKIYALDPTRLVCGRNREELIKEASRILTFAQGLFTAAQSTPEVPVESFPESGATNPLLSLNPLGKSDKVGS